MVDSLSSAQAGFLEGRFIDMGVKWKTQSALPAMLGRLLLIIQIQLVWKGPNKLKDLMCTT